MTSGSGVAMGSGTGTGSGIGAGVGSVTKAGSGLDGGWISDTVGGATGGRSLAMIVFNIACPAPAHRTMTG
jgi:hypothetical protein